MKVLLIQPPHYYSGGNRFPDYFPLGLGYIAKVLLNSGHQVEVFDIWAHQLKNEEVTQKVKEFDCDVIGISAISTQYAYTKWLISEIKKHHDCPVVVGNALATLTPEIVLEHTQADICVIGEGEITFKNVIEALGSLEKVKGIHFKQNGGIVQNEPQEYVKNLDTIEFPAWDLFPMDIYLKYCRVYGTNIQAMIIIAGRGCPYSCRFCSKTFRGVRFRSADNIIQEIKMLIEKYGIGGIVFGDELAIINKERTYELCEKIKSLNIRWKCQGRSNVVDFDMLKKMKESGCVAVGYGVESGSQTILNNMNKQITPQQSAQAIRNTIKTGIQPVVQLMYGYPGENETTLRETVQFLKNLPYIRRSALSITTPLPGNELWDYVIGQGLIKNREKYLEELTAGYMHDGKSPLINLTDFTEKEFYQHLRNIERELLVNKMRRYPYAFAKDYLFRALTNYRRGGFKQFVKRAVRFAGRFGS